MDYLGTIFNFSYDANGTPIGFRVTEDGKADEYYYYGVNSRGDIVSIYNVAGGEVVQYTYDAYGKILSEYSTTGYSTIATANPLRYRGYVYDRETGLYYLQSRYYDPKTCRFINADGYCSTGQGILGNNMFAYCNNNPVMYFDPTGTKIFECCPYGDCYHCSKEKKKSSVLPEATPNEVPCEVSTNNSSFFQKMWESTVVIIESAYMDVGLGYGIGASASVAELVDISIVPMASDLVHFKLDRSGTDIGITLVSDVGVSFADIINVPVFGERTFQSYLTGETVVEDNQYGSITLISAEAYLIAGFSFEMGWDTGYIVNSLDKIW